MNYFKLPPGVQDILPEESYNLNEIKKTLSACFASSGCRSVTTAGLEYYDTYSKIGTGIPQSKMFKMTDSDGSIIVLRPDVTLAAARIAATKLNSERERVCYFSDVYEATSHGISSREIFQAGVEFFGEDGELADALLIALAVESLDAVGLDDSIIDIGHVGFLKSLLTESGLTIDEADEIRRLIGNKDMLGAEIRLREFSVSDKVRDVITQIPSLFGENVFTKAETLVGTDKSGAFAALSSLKKVYAYLCEFGLKSRISIDLSTVKDLAYYTGIVFTGITDGADSNILTGGRYDELTGQFGKKMSAVGFAIGLKRVLVALERKEKFKPLQRTEAVITVASGGEGEAFAFAKKLRGEGKSVVIVKDGVTVDAKESYRASGDGVKKL